MDRALAWAGVPLLPSYKAGSHGLELRTRVQAILGREVPVLAVYAYSGYKVLTYLTEMDDSRLSEDYPGGGFGRWWRPQI